MMLLQSLGIVHVGLFVSAVMLLNVTPGPDTAYIVTRSIAQGPAAGVLSALGISLGCCVHTTLCAVGLTALLAASAAAFLVIKWIGAVYLIVMGVRIWWSTRSGGRDDAGHGAAKPSARTARGARQLLLQGFLTNVFNPKVLLFFVAFFPQFIDHNAISKATAVLALGAILVVMSTLYNALIACFAGGLTHKLRSMPRLSTWLERSVALAFVALGGRLLLLESPR
jgi:threonine/homoserine/homoserine lactone efflux protein